MRAIAIALLLALASPLFSQTTLFRVDTTADDGAGSLRAAFTAVNACSGDCRIVFNLPPGSVIEPLSPLPPLTACAQVTIAAGSTSRDGDRAIELSGAKQPAGNGIEYRGVCAQPTGLAPTLRIDGLAINRFPHDGIAVEDGHFSCFGCFVGTDATGRQARPNGARGITIQHENTTARIVDSVLSGNRRSGVFVWDARRVDVEHCAVGVRADGVPLPNGASGVFIRRGALIATRSTIAHNAHFGIAVAPEATMVTFLSALHANGVQPIDYGLDGPTHHTPNMPDVPELLGATYDAASNTTFVRGRVTITRPHGYRHAIAFYASARSLPGETPISEMANLPFRADVRAHEFEIGLPGDLRGQLVTAALNRGYDEETHALVETSEMSNGVTVR